MIYIPNLLTLLRIAMVPLLIVLLQNHQYAWSLLVFVAAGISDAIDGYIAKRFNAITELGSILDPLADKALLVSTYVMLSLLQIIPFWLMIVVVFRDLIIVIGYLIMVLFFGSIEMSPLRVSKLNTLLQIFYVIVVLAGLAGMEFVSLILSPLAYLVLLTSVLSGGAYVYIWSLKATQSTDTNSP